jgi:hypothetical protein
MPVATARRDGLTNRQRPQMTDAPGTFGARVLRLFDYRFALVTPCWRVDRCSRI